MQSRPPSFFRPLSCRVPYNVRGSLNGASLTAYEPKTRLAGKLWIPSKPRRVLILRWGFEKDGVVTRRQSAAGYEEPDPVALFPALHEFSFLG